MGHGYRAGIALAFVGAVAVLPAAPAAAHVVPSTTIELDVHDTGVTAALTLPTEDLATASGIAIPDGEELSEVTRSDIAGYVHEHFAVTSEAGSWDVSVGDLGTAVTEQWGTGEFPAVTATATLVPPRGADARAFTLDYDAIVHQVVTADIFVTLRSDSAAEEPGSARSLGTIALDTVSGTVPPFDIDLDEDSAWPGFVGMVEAGVSHIADGTDHQMFLLALLLPAPLLAARGRWSGTARTGTAVRRIGAVTIAFTIGHSVTLALGALGLPVPRQTVEALIALSILIAAGHAMRPLFAEREPLIAGVFGLVHGMAFSTTLSELDLTGGQLALSLLGFNLGIELMQLAVVLIVLPPLLVLARTPLYRPLRIGAAVVTGVAAIGWLLDRLGLPTPLGAAADAVGPASPWIVLVLWVAAGLVLAQAGGVPARGRSDAPATPGPVDLDGDRRLDART